MCHLEFELVDRSLQLTVTFLDLVELVKRESLDDRLSCKAKRHLSLAVKLLTILRELHAERVLVVDDRATEKALDDGLFATNGDDNLNDTLLDDVNRINRHTRALQDGVVRVLLRIKAVDDLVEDRVSVLKMREEWQLLEGLLHKAHVLVVVVKDTFLDVLQDSWVLGADLREVLLGKLSDGAVLEGDDGRGGKAVVDERNLAEELALAENLEVRMVIRLNLHIGIALFLSASEQLRSALGVEVAVAEVKHALALGNHVEVLTWFKFLNDHVVGRLELCLHPGDDRPEDLVLSLELGNFGEWVLCSVLFGNFHYSCLHLKVIFDDI